MTIMSHKDCEEWAAMIAQMQDYTERSIKKKKKKKKQVRK